MCFCFSLPSTWNVDGTKWKLSCHVCFILGELHEILKHLKYVSSKVGRRTQTRQKKAPNAALSHAHKPTVQ